MQECKKHYIVILTADSKSDKEASKKEFHNEGTATSTTGKKRTADMTTYNVRYTSKIYKCLHV